MQQRHVRWPWFFYIFYVVLVPLFPYFRWPLRVLYALLLVATVALALASIRPAAIACAVVAGVWALFCCIAHP